MDGSVLLQILLFYAVLWTFASGAILSGEITRLGLFLCIAGLIFAPVAGLMLRSAVRKKGLPVAVGESPWRFGAMASACLLIPWIYMMLRLHNARLVRRLSPYKLGRMSYGYLLVGPVLMLLYCSLLSLSWWHRDNLYLFVVQIFVVLFLFSALSTWIHMRDKDSGGSTDESSLWMLFPRKHMMPLLRASVWTIIAMAALEGVAWALGESGDDLKGWFTVTSLHWENTFR